MKVSFYCSFQISKKKWTFKKVIAVVLMYSIPVVCVYIKVC